MALVYVGVFCSLFALIACGDGSTATPSSPTPLTAPTPSPVDVAQTNSVPVANWRGDALVLSKSGSGGCGWGTVAGETRQVLWRVAITGSAVVMDEDVPNWPNDHIPYRGSLDGQRFTATYSQGADYRDYVCQFKGAELEGRFSADFSSFEATETLVWGAPGAETIIKRQWRGSTLVRQ
jgi:hypothetical protein